MHLQTSYFQSIIQPTLDFIALLKDKKFTFNSKVIKKQQQQFEQQFRALEKLFDPRPKRGIPQILYPGANLHNIQDTHSAELTQCLLKALDDLKELGTKDRALGLALQLADRKLSKTEQLMRFRLARFQHNQSFAEQQSQAKELANSIDPNEWIGKFSSPNADIGQMLAELSDLIEKIIRSSLPDRVPSFLLDESNPNDATTLDFASAKIGQLPWQRISAIIDGVEHLKLIPETNKEQFEEIIMKVSPYMQPSSEKAKVDTAKECLESLTDKVNRAVEQEKPGFLSSSNTQKYIYNMLRRLQFGLNLANTTFTSVGKNPNSPTADDLLGQQVRMVIQELHSVIVQLLNYKSEKGDKSAKAQIIANFLVSFKENIQREVDIHFPLPHNSNLNLH